MTQEDESGCNRDIPGWGESLGKVRFVSNRVWTIGVHTWSDAVTAENCKKESFDGGERGRKKSGYNADCRQNTEASYGDLFSWCAVKRYRNQLCPAGWRVPTTEDFIALSQWLEGAPYGWQWQEGSHHTRFDYPEWGGKYGGSCDGRGYLYSGESANYWTLSEFGLDTGMEISFYTGAMIFTGVFYKGTVFFKSYDGDIYRNKKHGNSLRCVRTD